jgi:O-antigen ligase
MYPTPTIWLEIGIAALLGIVLLWTKAEYGLFLYGLALGFPDLAYPLGTTINLRLEDVLIALFLARAVLWTPASLTQSQRKIFTWQALFLAACLLSIVVETAQATPPSGYDAARLAGCTVIIGVLPLAIQSMRRLRFLTAGLMCGGIALVIQVHQHLGDSSLHGITNFQQLKSAATFGTWNPNTIGQAALLLVFAGGSGAFAFSRTLTNRILWPCLATGFALLPALVFVRGTTISIAAGFILFLCLMRRWKWALVFATACLGLLLILRSSEHGFVQEATTVNVTTGEGFSHRFDRWELAFQAIQSDPFLGQGFGQELAYMTLLGSEGRSHNAYLTVWMELGLGGLFLFLAGVFQYARAGFSLYRNARFQSLGALILALVFALGLDSLGLATLYWEKLPTIALSVAIAMVGISERGELEPTADRRVSAAFEQSTQLT